MVSYALAIFTGAFLLFQVQPLIGKYILPWFGGSPGVWTTCMLFFQTLLLGGYAYAHFSSRHLKPKQQAVLHVALLLLSVALLPITPSEHWKPENPDNPTLRILALLTVTLGLPYFVLSATGPLLQQWFSLSRPGTSPYRLYALSNVGSLLALISYPFYFETHFPRHSLADFWSVGLWLFVTVCSFCALRVFRLDDRPPPVAAMPDVPLPPEEKPPPLDKLLWLMLPAIASILLLATTNKLCQDVAVIPFLWVLPLCLYLLTFILCFDHPRWYHRGVFATLVVVSFVVIYQLLDRGQKAPLLLQISGYAATLFVAGMVCHGELYRLKPVPRHLTSFYLLIAAGGALGGLFVAIVAPLIFKQYLELQVGLWLLSYFLGVVCFRAKSPSLVLGAGIGVLVAIVVASAMSATFDDNWRSVSGHLADAISAVSKPSPEIETVSAKIKHAAIEIKNASIGLFSDFRDIAAGLPAAIWEYYKAHWIELKVLIVAFVLSVGYRHRFRESEWQPRMVAFLMLLPLYLGIVFVVQVKRDADKAVSASRNFYGTLNVFEYNPEDDLNHYYLLLNGAITHGLQFTDAEKARWPTTYYGESSGIGLALRNLSRPDGRRIGVVGLGTGSLAAYGEPGDYLRIYEINPEVEKLARMRFTYLADCPSKIDVVLGDARLLMDNELRNGQPQRFDLIALDAFSSDAIPVHLLTTQAFETYLKHLAPRGVIAVHTSNRYLELRPIVEKLARHSGLRSVTIFNDYDLDWWVYNTTWMLLTRDDEFLEQSVIRLAAAEPDDRDATTPLWTDDHTSLFEILKR